MSDLALLMEAARAAGDIALRYWQQNPEAWDKPDGAGPVTEADMAVNQMLEDRLRSARPAYGWLSEESEDGAERLDAQHLFIIDPIDGTRAFIAGEDGFAHALAVVEAGRVLAGVVYLPAQGRMFTATATGPALMNDTPIHASPRAGEQGARALTTNPSMAADHWPGGVPDLRRSFRPSLAHRMCLVAEGQFDAMITLRDAWEWDIAAGTLIAERAGVRVTDRNGAALRFNRPEARSAGVIAAAPWLHGDLMARRIG